MLVHHRELECHEKSSKYGSFATKLNLMVNHHKLEDLMKKFGLLCSLPPKVGCAYLVLHVCLESQGCHFTPLSYFLSCFLPSPLALSVMSFFS